MAGKIGTVVAEVTADDRKLKSGLSRAAASVKNFSSSTSRRLQKVTTDAAKMAAGATAAGAAMTAALYVRQSKVIDSLAKTAESLGVTTASLQAMRHVADLNGVSAEKLDAALVRMTRSIGEAATIGGTAERVLSMLGLSAEELAKMAPSQQMEILAKALEGVGTQAEKVAIANQLFGRSGAAMLTTLKQLGNEGLDPTRKKLERLGIALSGVDTAQVEAANDAFFEAQQVIEGVANTLTVKLAPFVDLISKKFVEAAEESGGFGNQVDQGVEMALTAVAKFADVLHGVKVAFKGVEVIGVGFGASVVSVFQLAAEAVTVFIDSAIGNANAMISVLNQLPNVDIASIDPFTDSAFMEGLRSMADEARNKVGAVRSELHQMAMQELPSEQVEKFLTEVQQLAAESAAKVAEARESAITPELPLEDIVDKYAAQEAAYFQHMQSMFGITRDAYTGMDKVINSHWGTAATETAGAMKSIVGTMGKGSKTAFEISKKWALADAIISTAQGIAAGVRLGWPMAIPAVAYAAANGYAQISAIKSQSFGGGGGASAAAAPTQSAAPQQAQQSAPQQSQTLTVSAIDPGAIFSGAAMQESMEKIYEFSKDGGKVVFAA